MKKLLSILALALCFVACQNDAVESVSNSDLVDVVLTVDAPELGVTRADGDAYAAKNSAFGAIDFFNDADWAKYDVRYILEVYAENEDGTGEPIYRERLVNCLDKYAPTTFALRLVPERYYKFVVFADFVADGNYTKTEPADKLAIADWYYDTSDLRNITIKSDADDFDAMNEARDAYFITKNVKVSTTGLNEPLTLTRPFAKLRVITTDLDYIAGYAKPGYVEVKYHTEKVYKSFNAVNGMLNAEEMTGDELKYGYEVSKTIPYTAGYDKYSTNQTLFADYLLAVEGEQTTVNFTMAVYEDDTKTRKIHSHDFNTQIPIQRNHLTTIIGDLLTTQANITIEINDNFEDEWIYGAGDGNAIKIESWTDGTENADGSYSFVVKGENDFKVTVNSAAVENQTLTAGNYVFAEDAAKDDKYTFTVEALQANETTRALVDVEVIGGTMNVQAIDENYKITLDLVLQFAEDKDVRHAIYVYDGPITFGKVIPTLATPEVTADVEGNVVTLTWADIENAASYTIAYGTETDKPQTVVVEATTYVFTGEYETKYTFAVVATSANEEEYKNSKPATVTATTEAEPVVAEAYKLYFNNIAEWSEVYAHIWANEGEDLGLESVEWPGRELTETEELDGVTYYVFQLPAAATGKTVNVVFNDGNGTQTKDLAGVVEDNLFFDNYVEPEEPTALATPVVTYEINEEGNLVTLSWVAVEGAEDYTATYGENSLVVEGTTATFDAVVGTLTATVVANPADETKNTVSEAGTVEVTVEAPVVEPTYATVAEFLALSGDDVIPSDATADVIAAAPRYTLKGTITSVTQTTYGNFYLNDGTGEVLIYGLCSPEGEAKYWAASGAKVGDDIVVKTIRTEYNNAPQGKNATFVELTSPGTLAFYTVSTNAVDFTSVGGEQVIAVTAYNTDATVTATSDNSAFAVSVNGYNVTVSAAANELEEEVTGNITIKVGDLAETVVKTSLAAKPSAGAVEGGNSDFNTISDTNTSYVSGKTTAGWAYTNCAIFKGGTSDSSPAFVMIGDASNRALCMNGKTTAKGTITSPTITTGCGTLKFNYGLPFSDTKIKFTVDIIQNGEIVKTFTVDNSSATKLTKYSFEETIDVVGEFQIAFKNLSPSNSTSNKDRTAIWDVEWTGKN